MKEKAKKDFLHSIPEDFKRELNSEPLLKQAWKNLTTLARNEWICWIMSAKKEETRVKRIKRAQKELKQGKKRPCCWPGCPHRNPNTKKWFK